MDEAPVIEGTSISGHSFFHILPRDDLRANLRATIRLLTCDMDRGHDFGIVKALHMGFSRLALAKPHE